MGYDSLYMEKTLNLYGEEYEKDIYQFKQKTFTILDSINRFQSPFFKAKCYHLLGKIYLNLAEYDSARFYLYEGLDIRGEYGYLPHKGSSHEAIANLHFALGEDSIAMNHLYKSLTIKEKTGNPEYLKSLYISLGHAHYKQASLDSALYYYLKGKDIYAKNKDSLGIAAAITSIADVYYQLDSNRLAINFYLESVAIYDKLQRQYESVVPLYGLADTYKYIDKNDSALFYFSLALKRSKHSGAYDYLGDIFRGLGETFVYLGIADSSIIMYDYAFNYRDSVFSEAMVTAVMDSEKKYETKAAKQALELKTAENRAQSIENKIKTRTIYFLIGTLLLILIIGLFFLRSIRQKRKVKDLEIDQLLKNQEARSYAALLEGQNNERQRIANDLHDRLAGNLATIKIQFEDIDNRLEGIQAENKVLFRKVNNLLSEAVKDVRNISHDLTSGKLTELGLKGAVNDLAATISKVKNIQMIVELEEAMPLLSPRTEQEIYAMIQEMVSNTLKHAKATEIDLQLTLQDNLMNIIYEDNGIGFSLSDKLNKGLGIKSIQNRVENLNGTIAFDSVIGRGTIIIINIPL